MPNLEQIGAALAGAGAGLQGNGVQFMQQRTNERELEAKMSEQERLVRQKAFFSDAYRAKQFVDSGDIESGLRLFSNRAELLGKMKNSPENMDETNRMLDLFGIASQSSDPKVQEEAIGHIKSELNNYVEFGRATGYLEKSDQSNMQFGSTDNSFRDEAGNMFIAVPRMNPNTGMADSQVVPVGHSSKPQGQLQPVNKLGQTPEGIVRQKGDEAAAVESAKLHTQIKLKPEVEAAVSQAVAMAEMGVKQLGTDRSNATALAVYDTAMNGLVEALGGTTTGPIAGWMPAVTANAQIADGAIAAMAPVLKQLFRASGEGIFTDRDQALLMEMLPTRKDLPEARAAKLFNVDAIVRAKLAQPSGNQQQAPPQQPQPPQLPGKVKFLGFEKNAHS